MKYPEGRGKYIFLYLIFGIAFLLLAFRYAQIQLLFGDKDFEELLKRYPERRTVTVPGWRGEILTSDGVPLALTIDTYRYYLIAPKLSEEAARLLAERFAPIFNTTSEELFKVWKTSKGFKVFYSSPSEEIFKRYLSEKRKLFKELKRLTKKVLGKAIVDNVNLSELCSSESTPLGDFRRVCAVNEVLTWVGVFRANKRVYPHGRFLANTLGFVNAQNEGVAGVELMENGYLRSEPVKLVYLYGSRRFRVAVNPLENLNKTLTADVRLTIDYTVQAILERVKCEIVERWKPKKVVLMLMDIHSGKVYGLATYPDFDPNDVKSLNNTSNPAFSQVFEMGSVIKPFFVGLAFYLGKVKPGEKIKIGSGIKVGGHTVRDAERLPPYLTVEDVLVHSSNVGTVRIAKRLSREEVEGLIKLLGWRKRISNFPGATAGLVPDLKYPANRLYIAFGQGLGLTPAHLVSSYAALITGYAPVPQLVESVVREDGKVLYTFKPKYVNPDVPLFDERTRKWLKKVLRQIILRGTGKKAFPYYYEGGGKTGTAQIYDPKLRAYSKSKYITSFIGFFPYDNPRFVLLVSVYEPKAKRHYLLYGGTVAAPYWREIVNEVASYYGITPKPNVDWLRLKTKGKIGG